jgi:hypothetical protein
MIIVTLSSTSARATCNSYNCTQGQSLNLTCHDFKTWSEVNEAFGFINCAQNPPDPVVLKPSKNILFTSELNISVIQQTTVLDLYDTIGVNVYPWPFCPGCQKKDLYLHLSIIEFYVNNTNDYQCKPGLLPDDSAHSVSFISMYLGSLNLYKGNTNGDTVLI